MTKWNKKIFGRGKREGMKKNRLESKWKWKESGKQGKQEQDDAEG